MRAASRLLAFALVSASVSTAGADPAAGIDAREADGFARIVVGFGEDLPEYEVKASPSVIVVRFDAPLKTDIGDLASRLPGYVSAARLDSDGGALRLALLHEVRVNTTEAGDRLFVDLLPPDWTGQPPGLPQEVVDELAAREAAAERRRADRERLDRLAMAKPIDLRIAELPTFTRFVFVWESPVEAQIERAFDTVRLVFEEFGELDLAGRRVELPDYVHAIEAEDGRIGLEVELKLDPEAAIRGFREDASYVLDVTAPPSEETVGGLPLPELPSGAAVATRLEGAAEEEPSIVEAMFDEDGHVVESHLPLEPADPVDDAGPAAADVSAEDRPGAPGAVRAEARRFGASVRLAFPFEKKTASAVFERSGELWLVFDTSDPIDVGALKADLVDIIPEVEVIRTASYSIVRLALSKAMLMSVSGEQTTWIVTIGETTLELPRPLDLVRRAGANGTAEVAIGFPGAHSIHELRNPANGERLIVATGMPPARGVLKPHSFVEFSALPSAHGVAINQVADDLQASLQDNELVLGRDGGLTLSEISASNAYRPGRGRVEEVVRPGFVDINTENVLEPGMVYRLVSEHLKAVAQAEEGRRTAARLRLARALLATNLGAEGLAQLDLIAREDPAVSREPAVRALRGAALALMHRPEEALDELSSFGLSGSSDVALWRGLAEAQRANWPAAQEAMATGEAALPSHSTDRRRMFAIVAARAAIETGDMAESAKWISELREVTAKDDPALILLEGRLAEAQGDHGSAIRAYDDVLANGSGMAAAEARLRRTVLLHAGGAITAEQATEDLESLAVVWRGDEIELNALRHLARLHVEQDNHRRGFELMESATLSNPTSPITRALQDDMKGVFEALFLGGEADGMEPVEALSLYYDFRELTPIGRNGDEMIRNLADRLVEIDLLDQATELLAHQVYNRLKGAARAQVAAKLALVHVMNRKPAQALTVLARTRQAVLPQDVRNERLMIEARALSQTGRSELALDVLSALEGIEAQRLEAETLWRAERWQEAGELYERLLGDSWSGADALNGETRRDVLRAAIAYALDDDGPGLARIRGKFLAKMQESPDAQAFEVVSMPVPEQATAFRMLVQEIAATDTLGAFLEDYRRRYGGPVGATPTTPGPQG